MTDAKPTDAEVEAARWWLWPEMGLHRVPPEIADTFDRWISELMNTRAREILAAAGDHTREAGAQAGDLSGEAIDDDA